MVNKKKAFLKVSTKISKINMSNSDINLILAPQQVNIKKFCEVLNSKTNLLKNNLTITVYVDVYNDKTFQFYYQILTSKKIIKKISYNNQISLKALYEIAVYKNKNLSHLSLKSTVKGLINTAKLMNLNIIK